MSESVCSIDTHIIDYMLNFLFELTSFSNQLNVITAGEIETQRKLKEWLNIAARKKVEEKKNRKTTTTQIILDAPSNDKYQTTHSIRSVPFLVFFAYFWFVFLEKKNKLCFIRVLSIS